MFVLRGDVVGVLWYDGLDDREPDRGVVDECARLLPVKTGCSFDVGVLASGETALIETNDGFSIGRYGLDRRSTRRF